MEECRRCVSRKTHYAVSLEASLQRQVHGWGSGGAATETEVRHHPTRAATTTVVTMVVTLGSLSPNSHLREVVELPARRRKSGKPCNFEDGRWVISCIGQVTLAKLTIPRSHDPWRTVTRSVLFAITLPNIYGGFATSSIEEKIFLHSDVGSRVPLNFVHGSSKRSTLVLVRGKL